MFPTFLPTATAATEQEIEESIERGLEWLTAQQNPDGSWGTAPGYMTAITGFALIKLQMRAYELGYDSPFDPAYEYSGNVTEGWVFIFNVTDVPTYVSKQNISLQTHDGIDDDPDFNGNGFGVYFHGTITAYSVYTTGICLMALEASGTPGRMNDGGIDFDGDGTPDTFKEIAQDTAEWLAFAQGDSGNDEGGWGYADHDNQTLNVSTDNSNGGYAVLGLAAAEAFDCTVPGWVKNELDTWIGTIQDPVNGDTNDGGSYYNPDWLPGNPWCNELKAGNLIFQMTFHGDNPSTPRFQDALDYIARHWRDQNNDPGWGYNQTPAHYQAMFCLMKGFEYSEIELIDLNGDNVPEHDWYEEFAEVIVVQQNPDGSWPPSDWGNDLLNTLWALLTLEKITPPPPPPVGGTVYPIDKKPLYAMVGLPAILAVALFAWVLVKRT
ncbi:MAG: prenyltransferase/squalene oxidase repeat-containing protein [Candidatus Bathyarchaeota archaeon]